MEDKRHLQFKEISSMFANQILYTNMTYYIGYCYNAYLVKYHIVPERTVITIFIIQTTSAKLFCIEPYNIISCQKNTLILQDKQVRYQKNKASERTKLRIFCTSTKLSETFLLAKRIKIGLKQQTLRFKSHLLSQTY